MTQITHLTDSDVAAIERHLDELNSWTNAPRRVEEGGYAVDVVLNCFAYSLLDLLTERVNSENGTKYTREEVAAQMILRELRRFRP